jgi:hypothetical protein
MVLVRMSTELLLAVMLSVALSAIALHVAIVGFVRTKIPASLQSDLYAQSGLIAWGPARGGSTLSLKAKYLFPWVRIPQLPKALRRLLRFAQWSATVAIGTILSVVFVFFVGT